MHACLECGELYHTIRSAERAIDRGCRKCGGVDIDLAVYAKPGPAQSEFRLTNDPPRNPPAEFHNLNRSRQPKLFIGLNDLPGQQYLV